MSSTKRKESKMDSQPPPERSRNWLELPRDLTASILLRLGAVEILENAQFVCCTWYNICRDPSMWTTIEMHNFRDINFDIQKMCRHAVDRSFGGLIDLTIEYFGTDELLKYIAHRSRHVKRLRLINCISISNRGMSEAAAKFPLLEDFEVYNCRLSKEAFEVVGRSCPLLRSLKFNGLVFRSPHIESDEEVLAIAGNMPGLHHLQLIGSKLTNEGLQAILDGCSHLKSLDLRRCFNVNLDGQLEKSCAERLKDFRRPNDSTDDFPFSCEDIGSSNEDYYVYDDYSDISWGSDTDDYGNIIAEYYSL